MKKLLQLFRSAEADGKERDTVERVLCEAELDIADLHQVVGGAGRGRKGGRGHLNGDI